MPRVDHPTGSNSRMSVFCIVLSANHSSRVSTLKSGINPAIKLAQGYEGLEKSMSDRPSYGGDKLDFSSDILR